MARKAWTRCSSSDRRVTYAKAREHVLGILPKGGVGAEIGVWKGDFSALILRIAQPKTLHLIDPWQIREDKSHAKAWYGAASGTDMDAVYQGVRARFADQISSGQVQFHRKTSREAASDLPDDGLDFVYVDGDHAYAGVSDDLELSFTKTRPGGLICIDDHMDGKWWGDGVIRATNELLGRHPRGLEVVLAYATQVVIKKR